MKDRNIFCIDRWLLLGILLSLPMLVTAAMAQDTACGEDLQQFYRDVPAGEGRIMNCLDKNEDRLSQRGRAALKDVGLKE